MNTRGRCVGAIATLMLSSSAVLAAGWSTERWSAKSNGATMVPLEGLWKATEGNDLSRARPVLVHAEVLDGAGVLVALGAECRWLDAGLHDVDADGILDLLALVEDSGNGLLVLWRGNADYRRPRSQLRQMAQDGIVSPAPFLDPARALALPFVADRLASGDFDADGSVEVAVAARGKRSLQWLEADEQGKMQIGRSWELPGVVTALASGELGRRDGLPELAIGMQTSDRSVVQVLQSRSGSLDAPRPAIPMPAPVRALLIGSLHGSGGRSLIAGVGSEVVIVRGDSAEAAMELHRLPGPVVSLELADAAGGAAREIVALGADGALWVVATGRRARRLELPFEVSGLSQLSAARLGGRSGEELMLVDEPGGRLTFVGGEGREKRRGEAPATVLEAEQAPSKVLAARLDYDALDELLLFVDGRPGPILVERAPLPTFFVNAVDDLDDGTCNQNHCSLREAIEASNDSVGALEAIEFTTGLSPIVLTSALPTITDPVTIDGVQTSGLVSWLTRVDGSSVVGSANWGLRVSAGSSTVSGLHVSGFPGSGLILSEGGGNVVSRCRIGDTLDGIGAANGSYGVFIDASSDNVIGGSATADRNVISGNGSAGIYVRTTAGEPAEGAGNRLLNNYIGVSASGLLASGNGRYGVHVAIVSETTIGETGAGNVVGANGASGIFPGVFLADNTETGALADTLVQGNRIGVGADGLTALGNIQRGVDIQGGLRTTIGGAAPGQGNVIAANGLDGIGLGFEASATAILGNSIGLGSDGSTPAGNGGDGIQLGSDAIDSTIGGPLPGEGNQIAHNSGHGILDSASVAGNAMRANRIWDNLGLAIDLGQDGVTPNDPGDVDSGPNGLQNFPVIEAVDAGAGSVTVSLDSAPLSFFDIDVFGSDGCDPSGFGEAEDYLGSAVLFTNGSGSGEAAVSGLGIGVLWDRQITATATGPDDSTSELSACFQPPPPLFRDGFDSGDTQAWTASVP